MEERTKIYVGLDVHKDSISVAAAELGRSPARLIAKVAHDVNKLLKVLGRIGSAEQLHLVYEAGPTGFGLQRALEAKGYVCEIIAPSQIPKRSGKRVKTDARDCLQLAECSRAGQLSAVWIPDPGDEAIRDLSRAREDAVNRAACRRVIGSRASCCAMTSATPARPRGVSPTTGGCRRSVSAPAPPRRPSPSIRCGTRPPTHVSSS